MSYNRNPWQMETDKRISLLFSLPLDKFTRNSAPHTARRAWATAGTHYDAKGNYTHSTGINGVALENRNLSYNLQQSYSNNGQAYGGSAGLTYNGAYNAVTSNYSYSKHYRQASIGIDGGVIIHQEGITFGQALGDTNILVDAAGASGLSVENRTALKPTGADIPIFLTPPHTEITALRSTSQHCRQISHWRKRLKIRCRLRVR